MPSYSETRILPYDAVQLFNLVADIERYPEFLPWCRDALIRDRKEDGIVADLVVGDVFFSATYRSKVTFDSPHRICMTHGGGRTLKELDGLWQFKDVADGCCQLDFRVEFALQSRFLERLLVAGLPKVITFMVQSFERRAEALYGKKASHNCNL